MPRSSRGLDLARGHRGRQVALSRRVGGALGAAWGVVRPEDLRATTRQFASAGAVIVEAGQRGAATLSDLFFSQYASEETGDDVPPSGLDPETFVGLSETDA